ncbi:mannitol dehydrogenase family protein [Phenylobacterium sp.]|uniref:mannitol dehydrogenase family protein n=1 Tax=Phenylobacterium sp. TaxID=1871053 RepID=UPI002CA3B929|nr:mannitol dehydrogenase family protein [Phenylobacterium sp.]HLZ75447.1 mannitol dehydrogenase family protein [Phenylobacterium sp.]
MSPRLSETTLPQARAEAIRPAYDRAESRIGVVHFGPGAFHRAHQAFFFDRMLTRDPGLAISVVSLRSDAVRAALEPQDGLYSLLEREAEPSLRVIGAIREVLTAPGDPEAVFARLTDPMVRLVSATVTEKGYCLTPAGDLDTSHPDIRRDLADPARPSTLVGWLVEGLRRRRTAGLPGLTALSCDNLSRNGDAWRRTALQFARARGEADLARWIEGEVAFPGSMVDSITPATDEALRTEAEQALGLTDAWPVQRERFAQWVIGGDLGADAATFAEAGVILTGDVAGFERAKLRLLNGAHSTLAYVGLALGVATVAQAMAEPRLAAFVEALMRREIAPTVAAPAGLDLDGYIGEVLTRFRNPAIVHKLSQIAWDGSQKLPVRLLATLDDALTQNLPIDRLATGVAAWMLFVRRQAGAGEALVDPLARDLVAVARTCTGEPAADVARFLALDAVFPRRLAQSPRLRAALEAGYASLSSPNARAEFAA